MSLKKLDSYNLFSKLFAVSELPAEEQAQTIDFLVRFAWFNILFFPLGALGIWIASPEQYLRPMMATLLVVVVYTSMLFLTKRGKVKLASIVTIGFLWIFVSFLAFTGEGVESPSYIGYFVVAFLAGILLGGRVLFIMTGISIFSGLVLVYLANVGLLPEDQYTQTPFITWVIATMFMVLLALLQAYNKRVAQHSLERAEAELAERKQAEERLRASEEKFAKAFLTSPDSIIISDLASGQYLEVNDSFLRDTGFERDEIIGFTSVERNIWATPEERSRMVAALQTQGQLQNMEVQYRRKSGEVRDALISAEIIELGGGGKHLLATVRDITERKQMEAALNLAAQRFRQVMLNVQDVVWLASLDGSTLLEVSQALEELYGLPVNVLKTNPDLWMDVVHPDDKGLASASNELLAENGYSETEYRIRRPDGSVRWVLDRKSILKDAQGKPVGIGGVATDITGRKQAEEKLRESEEKYRSLLGSLDNVIASVDESGRFLYLNDTAALQLGGAAESLVGKTMQELFPAAFASRQLERVRQVIHEDRAVVTELPTLVQGQLRWYRTAIYPVHDEAGKVIYALINSTDIHNLKMAEASLRQQLDTEKVVAEISQQFTHIDMTSRYQIILGALARLGSQVDVDRCYVFSYDSEADVFSNTHEWCAEGIKPSDNLARRYSAHDNSQLLQPLLHGEVLNIPSVADLPVDDPGCASMKENGVVSVLCLPLIGEKGTLGLIGFESVRREHTWQEAEINLLSIVGRILATGHDRLIKEREILQLNQSLEQRVGERTAEVHDLYDNAPAGYSSLDAAGLIISMNQTQLNWLGYRCEELLGRPITILLSESSQAVFRESFPIFRQTGSVSNLELEFIRKDGSLMPVLVNASAIYDQQGNYISSRSTIIDNSQRKAAEAAIQRANQELEHALRMKDAFLANMSHELRTPLNGILGVSEILQEEIRGPLNERQHTMLKIIDSSGRHLLSLINDILDLSKVEAGKLEIHLEVVSIADLCQASLMFIKQPAMKKGITVEFLPDPLVSTIEADSRRMKQVLVNLLNNAVKFTPAKGRITLAVHAQSEKHSIDFSISDTGIGIARDDLQRLFTPFTQVESSLTRQYEGTGLGLALVKELTELHGGNVWVESEPGKGSTFTVSIPWIPNASTQKALFAAENSDIPGTQAAKTPKTVKKVLLAEDNEVNSATVGDYLESLGYTMIYAANGHEAIEKAYEYQPDIILMDVQMPVMDGLAATRRLRAAPQFASVPIVALTALAMPGDRERCLEAGATVYVSKPVGLKELASLISALPS